MKKKKILWLVIILLLITVVVFIVFKNHNSSHRDAEESSAPMAKNTIEITSEDDSGLQKELSKTDQPESYFKKDEYENTAALEGGNVQKEEIIFEEDEPGVAGISESKHGYENINTSITGKKNETPGSNPADGGDLTGDIPEKYKTLKIGDEEMIVPISAPESLEEYDGLTSSENDTLKKKFESLVEYNKYITMIRSLEDIDRVDPGDGTIEKK